MCSGIKESCVYLTGVKALRSGLVISSSVDQRLALWELVKEDQVFTDFFITSLSSRAILWHCSSPKQLPVELVGVSRVESQHTGTNARDS